MPRATPPFRTDCGDSLLRPAAQQARADHRPSGFGRTAAPT